MTPGDVPMLILQILHQLSLTEPGLNVFALACLRENESPRFTKRIFRGALKIMVTAMYEWDFSMSAN